MFAWKSIYFDQIKNVNVIFQFNRKSQSSRKTYYDLGILDCFSNKVKKK